MVEDAEAVEAIHQASMAQGSGWASLMKALVTHPWFTTIQTEKPYDPTFHQPTRRPQGPWHHQHRPASA